MKHTAIIIALLVIAAVPSVVSAGPPKCKPSGKYWMCTNYTIVPSPTPKPTATLKPTATPKAQQPVCDCTGNIYNCGDFNTHSQAQACFSYCVSVGAGDVHQLDGDHDGSACESLP